MFPVVFLPADLVISARSSVGLLDFPPPRQLILQRLVASGKGPVFVYSVTRAALFDRHYPQSQPTYAIEVGHRAIVRRGKDNPIG